MSDYVQKIIDQTPEELMKGPCTCPASNHVFKVNEKCPQLEPSTAILYHHLTAQLLYLGKHTRPDLLLAISFLCTRVQSPDKNDWKKLGRCLKFLQDTKANKLTLQADGSNVIS